MRADLFGTVTNDAATARRGQAFRAWLCARLGCPYDSCYTTGELARDAKREGKYGWDPDAAEVAAGGTP